MTVFTLEQLMSEHEKLGLPAAPEWLEDCDLISEALVLHSDQSIALAPTIFG
jgi:hypothetical protein